ncbi:MAG: hypothetical protein ACLVEJ_05975 [Parabacteroides sp.]
MGKNNQEVENIRLREEVKTTKKANKSLEKSWPLPIPRNRSFKKELKKKNRK